MFIPFSKRVHWFCQKTLGSSETFDQREIVRHLSCVCLFVRPSVVITIASERKFAIGRPVLKSDIDPQNQIPPK